jgi:predicted nucleic acid-binding protein
VLDEATALYAAELAQTYGLATADALVYATALRQRALLVTCDAHFEGLAGVDYQPKLVH